MLLNDINLIGFALEDGVYRAYMHPLNVIITKHRDSLPSDGDSDNVYAQKLDAFLRDIEALAIPENEMIQYQSSAISGPNITEYKRIKERLRYAIAEHGLSTIKCLYALFDVGEKQQDPEKKVTRTDKRKVLNRNNPFAAVDIASNTYIISDGANANNVLQTLSFTTGHTLTNLEENEEHALALLPGFSVKKMKGLDVPNGDINFSDTISTRDNVPDISYI